MTEYSLFKLDSLKNYHTIFIKLKGSNTLKIIKTDEYDQIYLAKLDRLIVLVLERKADYKIPPNYTETVKCYEKEIIPFTNIISIILAKPSEAEKTNG